LCFDDRPGQRAPIKGVRPLGRDQPERFGEVGLHQPVAFRQRHAAGTEDRCSFGLDLGAAVIVDDIGGEKAVDAKAALGELDRRRHGVSQLFRAPAGERGVDAAQGARDADRESAGGGEGEGHWLALGREHVGARCRRRALARIDDEGLAGLGQMHQHEAAATDAGRLRLDHVERELHRGGGIDGVAALGQHACAGCRRGRMRGRDHAGGHGGHRGAGKQ
jgi:hypothetical protein